MDSMFLDMQSHSTRLAVGGQIVQSEHHLDVCKYIWKYVNESNENINIKDFYHELKHFFDESILAKNNIDDDILNRWYYSALTAIKYQEGREYVLLDNKITIVDYSHTGQVLSGSRWDSGLHSFLEMKHALPVESEQLVACSTNHVDYFNLYNKMYGLSGTLGNCTDRDELKRLYNVNCYDSPTYLPDQKQALEDVITINDVEKLNMLIQIVDHKTQLGHPVLVLCETINASKKMYAALQNKPHAQIYNAIQENSTQHILDLAGHPSAITVATNTAARGSNICLILEAVKKGLHVIITFPTHNIRVEKQAIGRAGRQGQPGSYQYLLSMDDLLSGILSGYANQPSSIALPYQENLSPSIAREFINQWKNSREKRSQLLSEQRLQSRKMVELQQQAQEFFFSFPEYTREKFYKTWAEYYSRIDYFIRAKCYSEENYQQGKKYIANEIKNFFAAYAKVDQVGGLIGTALHYAVYQGDEKLAVLLKVYCPESLVELDQFGRKPYEMAAIYKHTHLQVLLDPNNKQIDQGMNIILSFFKNPPSIPIAEKDVQMGYRL